MATADDGWNEEELSRMTIRGRGCLPEADGRSFMALLDICHFLVDQITQAHNFSDVDEASNLRATDTQKCMLLSAQMWTYWYSAPAGPGVYEMLLDWTSHQQRGGRARSSVLAQRELGNAKCRDMQGVALQALVVNECAQWPRRRKTGAFYFAGEDASGAALLADAEAVETLYRVVGLSTSLGDVLRANDRSGSGDVVGSALLLTLLPFMDVIVYDGTLRGAPPNRDPSLVAQLKALVAASAAEGGGSIVVRLPTVPDAPLIGQRVLIEGLQAKPELNGRHGVASSFDGSSGRYCVSLEDGGSFKLKPANLSKAAAPPARASSSTAEPAAALTLTATEKALQERLRGLRTVEDFWVFRRMGYTEAVRALLLCMPVLSAPGSLSARAPAVLRPNVACLQKENPSHMGMIMSGNSGMVVAPFQSKQLAPTAAEYLTALEAALFGGRAQGVKPSSLAVDEKGAVARLKLVLGPVGIQAGYYPPPTEEELSAMGVPP